MIVRRSTYDAVVDQRDRAEAACATLLAQNTDLKARLATLGAVNDGLNAQIDALKVKLLQAEDRAIAFADDAEVDEDLSTAWRKALAELDGQPGWSAVSNPCPGCGRPMHPHIAHYCLIPAPRGARLPHTCGPGGIGDTCAACGVEDDFRHVRLEDR